MYICHQELLGQCQKDTEHWYLTVFRHVQLLGKKMAWCILSNRSPPVLQGTIQKKKTKKLLQNFRVLRLLLVVSKQESKPRSHRLQKAFSTFPNLLPAFFFCLFKKKKRMTIAVMILAEYLSYCVSH